MLSYVGCDTCDDKKRKATGRKCWIPIAASSMAKDSPPAVQRRALLLNSEGPRNVQRSASRRGIREIHNTLGQGHGMFFFFTRYTGLPSNWCPDRVAPFLLFSAQGLVPWFVGVDINSVAFTTVVGFCLRRLHGSKAWMCVLICLFGRACAWMTLLCFASVYMIPLLMDGCRLQLLL